LRRGIITIMNAQLWIQVWGFVVAILLILAGILFSRQDVKELRLEVSSLRSELHSELGRVQADLHSELGRVQADLRSEIGRVQADLRSELGGKIDRVQADLAQFYRSLGQHDVRIENLEKRS
jgi:hypothetical protein